MKKESIAALLSLSAAFLMLTGCGNAVTEEKATTAAQADQSAADSKASESGEEKSASADSQSFTYAIKGDTGNTINVLTVDDRYGLMTMKALYAPLYYIHPDGNVDYILAKSMTASEDGKTWTLVLNDGLKWSDGEPITADDVFYTIDSHNKQDQNLFINGKAIEMNQIDEHTLSFTTEVPSSSVFELLSAETFILPKHYYEKKGNFDVNLLEEKPVCSGPYTLDSYMTGQYLKFKANENSVLGKPQIETLIYKIVESDDTATLALQNGEIDAWSALPDLLKPYKDNPAFKIYTYSEGRVAYMRLNTASKKMQDKSYREGILHAVDRNEILQAAYSDPEFYSVSYSFLPNVSAYYNPDVEKFDHDVELAKKLTANGAKQLKIAYINTDEVERQALTIQSELKEAGIDLELNPLDGAALTKVEKDKQNGDYDILLGGYIMGIDPSTFSQLFSKDKDNNYNFDAPEIDKLWREADMERDEAKRKELYNTIQQKIQEEAIFYPFGSNLKILVANQKVHGIEEAGLVPIYTFNDLSKLSIAS